MANYRHAVYAGSFDPITLGHTAIIERSTRLFDQVTVAIGVNPSKKGLFEVAERKRMIATALKHLPNIEVAHFDGLLIDFMRTVGAGVVVRGLLPEVETVFVLTEAAHVYISSSLVKEIAQNGGDASRYVPPVVHAALQA